MFPTPTTKALNLHGYHHLESSFLGSIFFDGLGNWNVFLWWVFKGTSHSRFNRHPCSAENRNSMFEKWERKDDEASGLSTLSGIVEIKVVPGRLSF